MRISNVHIALVLCWSLSACIPLFTQNLEFENIANQHNLKGNYFNSVAEDHHGYIWTSTKNRGIYRWDNNSYQHYLPDTSFTGFGHIHSINTDHNRKLWIASDRGLFYYNYEKDQITLDSHFIQSKLLECVDIWDVYFHNDEGYLGTACGIYMLNSDMQIERHIPVPEHFEGHGYKERQVISMHVDDKDESLLWIGTKYGLKSYDFNLDTLRIHPNPPKWHNTYSRNQQYAIYDIEQKENGDLWLAGCWSGGILKYESQSQRWNQFLYPGSRQEDPYHGNSLHSLTQLNDTLFFYSNNRGGGYFDLNQGKLKPIRFPEYDFHTNHDSHHIVDRHGQVWVVGIEGIFKSTRPIQIEKNAWHPDPLVKLISVNGRKYQSNYHLYLPVDSNDVVIQLGIPNEPVGSNMGYSYKIDDHEWTALEENTIVLNNIPGGTHIISYKANASLDPDATVNKLTIDIYVPFYKSWWFRLLAMAMAITAIWMLWLWRSSTIRREEQQKAEFEKRLAEVEMKALRAQMNPHFLFNTMNSINHFILKNDADKASHYLTKFSRLVRQVLYNSKSKTVSLSNELAALKLYIELEQLRFDHVFDYKISVDATIDQEQVKIPPLLIQPFVENAIWHGLMHLKERRGELAIGITAVNGNIEIKISDNGIGREASKKLKSQHERQKESLGLKITKDRMKTINQIYSGKAQMQIVDLHAEGEASGTLVRLTVPTLF